MFFDSKRAFSENREKTVTGRVGYFEGELLRSCSSVVICRTWFPVWRPLRPLRSRVLLVLCADQQFPGLSRFLQATRQVHGGRV